MAGARRERPRHVIEACRAEGRAALVGYLPVGYPDVDGSIAAMRAMVEAGVDIVEVGVPYSDPLMDGPVIQHAAEGAARRRHPGRDVFTRRPRRRRRRRPGRWS